METPFKIGETYYQPRTNSEQIEVACPTCYGARRVTMLLGSGEHVDVECEGCGKGYEGPRGSILEYHYEASASKFTVAAIHSMYEGKFTLKSTLGETCDWEGLCATEEQALASSKLNMARIVEQNMRCSESRTAYQRKNATWTVQYHEKCIKENERKIAWHRSKVSERRKVRAV